MMVPLVLAAVLIAAPEAPAGPSEAWLKGSVARVGTVYTPGLHLTTSDGKRYELSGDLVKEIALFEGGNTLEILCVKEKDGLLPRMKATDFRILELAGGDKPEIGHVKVEGTGVHLVIDAKRTLKLQDTPVARRLLQKNGEKVWVVGKPVSGGLFKIWRVGFLGTGGAASQPASAPTK
jgi:hypothetical protein